MATNTKQPSPLASLVSELRTLTDRISTAEAGEDPRAKKNCASASSKSPPS